MLKNIKTQAVFAKTEINNGLNINFLQNSLLGSRHTYSSKLSIGQRTSETPFILCKVFPLMSSISSNLIHEINFWFKNEKKWHGVRSGEYGGNCTCIILCFIKNCKSEVLRIHTDECLDVSTSSLHYLNSTTV